MASVDHLARVSEKEAVEIDYWRTSPTEAPGANSLAALVNKLSEARIFLHKLDSYTAYFADRLSIVELGAGQGWAAHIVKRQFPNAVVRATDISPHAIASCREWERIFGCRIDEARSCRSYELPYENQSIDLIYCFQSAHHFIRHRRTLREVHRVLRSGGIALYLHEPACAAFIHPLAHWRVNRKRPDVPEDVLIYKKIVQLAAEVGLSGETRFVPSAINRGEIETLYYAVLKRVPGLRYLLPCTADFIFTKA